MKRHSKLQTLRQAIDEMVDAGGDLDEVTVEIVDAAQALDAERRAALWLYARSRAESAAAGRTTETGHVHVRAPVGARGSPALSLLEVL